MVVAIWGLMSALLRLAIRFAFRLVLNVLLMMKSCLVGKTMHKVDEAVSLSDLKKLTLIYSNILENYFK